MNTITTMRQSLSPWARPLDIVVVTGGGFVANAHTELQLISAAWRQCGGGVVHSRETLEEALALAADSSETWLSAIAADACLPTRNPIGVVAAASFANNQSTDQTSDWQQSPLASFYRQLARMPVVRVLIGGDDLTPSDLAYFDNGLIDMRMAMNSQTHTQDAAAWAQLAGEVRNLVFNRMTATIPGLWQARPRWLTEPALNRALGAELEQRGICAWEWITSPNRLRCESADGSVSWLYLQSEAERQLARSEQRHHLPDASDAKVISIAPKIREMYDADRAQVLLGDAEKPINLEADWLAEGSGISAAWSDEEY